LPGRSAIDALQKTAEAGERAEQWKGIAKPDSAVAAGLDAIAREDKTFDPEHFMTGARTAYAAYAEGDRSTLRNLLSREVYEGFDAVIRERLSKGETVETRFVAIDRSDITAAEVRGGAAQVTVRCVDGSGLARTFFTSLRWSVRPCVRPVCAVRMTAG